MRYRSAASAAAFEAVNAVPEALWTRWSAHDFPDLVPRCFDNIVLGIKKELRERLGELPALRVVVHEVLPHIIEANETNNQNVGRKIIQEALRRSG